jgi:hypothetical protein
MTESHRTAATTGRYCSARSPWSAWSATRTERTTVIAEAFQALNDVGFTIPAQGATYWNGRESTASTTAAVARNAAHLTRALKASQYPPYPS